MPGLFVAARSQKIGPKSTGAKAVFADKIPKVSHKLSFI
jgi:hypothetical protein